MMPTALAGRRLPDLEGRGPARQRADEAFAGLVADGKTTPRGAPRNPLQLGATFWHFRHERPMNSRVPDAGSAQPLLPPG